VVGQTRLMTGLDISASGAWLVATAGHKAYVALTSTIKSGFTKYVSPERLTCLACHPLDDYFATGDDKGVIRLWYCLNERIAVKAVGIEKKAQTTTLHWHAHALSSIAFIANGAYLLSGGEESVLVIWQLHTGKKEFVPRVGAPIKTITTSHPTSREEEYLLGLADGTYTFVNAGTLTISRSFARIKLGRGSFSPFFLVLTILKIPKHFHPYHRPSPSIHCHRLSFFHLRILLHSRHTVLPRQN
jgi:NET1-associated nuclear protein 1 (U3 small nucleolar RNA-associated protein 17)